MKLIKFIISGGSAFGTNIVFLYLFTELFGWGYLFSSVLAFTIAIGVGFFLNKYWTFLDHSRDRIYTQVYLYLAINVFNLFLNTALLYILVDIFELWYILAQVIISAILAFESYFLYNKIFSSKTSQ